MHRPFSKAPRRSDPRSPHSAVALAAAIAISTAAVAVPERAEARRGRGRIPVLQQITEIERGSVKEPRVRSQDGSRIVFTSEAGAVPGSLLEGSQVYLYDVTRGLLRPVTDDPIHGSSQAARPTDQVAAGGRPEFVAFVSSADLDPRVGNADANDEIFLWEVESGRYHQLTDTLAPVTNMNPYSSDSGRCIVFDSNGDLDNNAGDDPSGPATGYSNGDGSREVFLYSLSSSNDFPRDGRFTQVSNGPRNSTSLRPVIGGYWHARQCQSTVYMSNHDQAGGQRSGIHIYVYHRPSATTSAMDAKGLPDGQPDGHYFYPSISGASQFARGPFVVFQTSTDLWRNGSSGSELFRYRIFHPRMTQYSDVAVGDIGRPVVSDGGGIIVYESTSQMLDPARKITPVPVDPNLNADGNREIFWQKGRRRVSQLTTSSGCENTTPSISDDATSVAFRSTCELIPGHNTDGRSQIFLYRTVQPNDPLACRKDDVTCECTIENRCCNEANGCLTVHTGRTIRPKRRGCADFPKRCGR